MLSNVSGDHTGSPLRQKYNISSISVGTRRAVSAVAIKLYRLNHNCSGKTNFSVGDGFPDVPFTKIAMQFLCGHGTPCPYVSVGYYSNAKLYVIKTITVQSTQRLYRSFIYNILFFVIVPKLVGCYICGCTDRLLRINLFFFFGSVQCIIRLFIRPLCVNQLEQNRRCKR